MKPNINRMSNDGTSFDDQHGESSSSSSSSRTSSWASSHVHLHPPLERGNDAAECDGEHGGGRREGGDHQQRQQQKQAKHHKHEGDNQQETNGAMTIMTHRCGGGSSTYGDNANMSTQKQQPSSANHCHAGVAGGGGKEEGGIKPTNNEAADDDGDTIKNDSESAIMLNGAMAMKKKQPPLPHQITTTYADVVKAGIHDSMAYSAVHSSSRSAMATATSGADIHPPCPSPKEEIEDKQHHHHQNVISDVPDVNDSICKTTQQQQQRSTTLRSWSTSSPIARGLHSLERIAYILGKGSLVMVSEECREVMGVYCFALSVPSHFPFTLLIIFTHCLSTHTPVDTINNNMSRSTSPKEIWDMPTHI